MMKQQQDHCNLRPSARHPSIVALWQVSSIRVLLVAYTYAA